MGINGDIALSKEKRPYIVYSGSVIRMLMGKENTVQFGNFMGKHLLSKIGAAVYDKIIIVPR